MSVFDVRAFVHLRGFARTCAELGKQLDASERRELDNDADPKQAFAALRRLVEPPHPPPPPNRPQDPPRTLTRLATSAPPAENRSQALTAAGKWDWLAFPRDRASDHHRPPPSRHYRAPRVGFAALEPIHERSKCEL